MFPFAKYGNNEWDSRYNSKLNKLGNFNKVLGVQKSNICKFPHSRAPKSTYWGACRELGRSFKNIIKAALDNELEKCVPLDGKFIFNFELFLIIKSEVNLAQLKV